ncbi:MAG TPA: hypothetical protein VEU08_24140, partial [Vicinamibacterales bacterium]|nr:hypothetical protein [Vicinamibacterales bacterium]
GLFSEFHSVLGALHYAREHGAAGVRVNFASPLYMSPDRGPNWWRYFFERDSMLFDGADAQQAEEVVLDRVVTKYGRYGGFSDVVQGVTPYFYPVTFGLDRGTLHEYVGRFAKVNACIRERAAALVHSLFEPKAFLVGVNYRGTDAVIRKWMGVIRHYRTKPVPYEEYADEVRRVLERHAPAAFQVFVATDESRFLGFMRRSFPDRVVAIDAPRAGDDGNAVHLDRSIPPLLKGESAMLDALLLARCNYLIKGRSNLSDAALVFNPALPYSFWPDVPLPALTM